MTDDMRWADVPADRRINDDWLRRQFAGRHWEATKWVKLLRKKGRCEFAWAGTYTDIWWPCATPVVRGNTVCKAHGGVPIAEALLREGAKARNENIVRLAHGGATQRAIAEEEGISAGRVSQIVNHERLLIERRNRILSGQITWLCSPSVRRTGPWLWLAGDDPF